MGRYLLTSAGKLFLGNFDGKRTKVFSSVFLLFFTSAVIPGLY